MLCQKLKQNTVFKIPQQPGYYFSLHNIALDLQSNDAVLYLLQNDKEILIAELSRVNGGVKSVNLCLDFWNCSQIQFRVGKGSVHIIGGYKKYNGAQPNTSNSNQNIHRQSNSSKSQPQHTSAMPSNRPLQQQNVQQQTPQPIPIRRSTRTRAPIKPAAETKSAKAAKRQKQALSSMAKYFQCDLSDQDQDDQDQDQNYQKSKQQQEQEDDDDDQDQDDDNEKDEEQDKEKQQENQMKEEKERGSSGRKVWPRSARLAARQAENKVDQNTSTQSVSDQKPQIRQGECHFSVPTRNPYN